MRTVEVRILPPQPTFWNFVRESLVTDCRQAGFGPAAPAPVHRFHVGVAHFLQIVGDQSRTETTPAIENKFCACIRDLLLDIALDDALAHVYSTGDMAFGPLVVF